MGDDTIGYPPQERFDSQGQKCAGIGGVMDYLNPITK